MIPAPIMRIAAIDCGTNSLHLLIAQMDDEGRYDVLHDLKEMPRLGEGVVRTGLLSDVAMDRALQTLSEYAHICERFKVEKIRAVATSAVRRARNGEEFVARVREKSGIDLDVISGEEEARLVARAVLAEPGFTPGRFLIFNVGGGSTEFAWGRGRQIRGMATLPVGAVTLTEEHLKNDPPRGGEVRALEQAVARALRQEVPDTVHPDLTLYGTGGTVNALAAIHQVFRFGASLGATFYPMGFGQARELYLTLLEKDVAQRRQVPALRGARAEIILAGAAIVTGIMRYLGDRDILASAHGLKFGLLAEESRDVKRRLLVALLEHRTDTGSPEVLHALHTRHLALRLFDDLAPLHGLGGADRELLALASLLHDIGHSVDVRRHHKHTYTLIREADLAGLAGARKEIVALVARYHRKAAPRMKHPPFAGLSRDERRIVRVLAAILRVADGLDRSHSQAVVDVRARVADDRVVLEVVSSRISTLDEIGAEGRKSLLEAVLGRRIEIANTGAAGGAADGPPP
jgi:exopolyphosphatase/guanosine-5'-triphosphate,3'-diphosphate pyrophosphatase